MSKSFMKITPQLLPEGSRLLLAYALEVGLLGNESNQLLPILRQSTGKLGGCIVGMTLQQIIAILQSVDHAQTRDLPMLANRRPDWECRSLGLYCDDIFAAIDAIRGTLQWHATEDHVFFCGVRNTCYP